MKVKIGDKIYDSYDQPIAVLFTSDEEIKAANRVNAQGRALGSFPLNYGTIEAHVYLNEGWDGLSYKVQVDAQTIINKLELPPPPELRAAVRGEKCPSV